MKAGLANQINAQYYVITADQGGHARIWMLTFSDMENTGNLP